MVEREKYNISGKTYIMRPPGCYFLGAAIMRILPGGIGQYLSGMLVTLGTGVFEACLWALIWLWILRFFRLSLWFQVFFIILILLGTPLAPYFGTLHHDIPACVLFALSLALFLARRVGLSYFVAGLTSLFSYNIFFLACLFYLSLGIQNSWSGSWSRKEFFRHLFALALGYVPMALVGWLKFRWLLPWPLLTHDNMTTQPAIESVLKNLYVYFVGTTSLTFNFPVYIVLATALIWILAKSKNYARRAPDLTSLNLSVAASVAIWFTYLLLITANGECQVGPRYLMGICTLLLFFFAANAREILHSSWVAWLIGGTAVLSSVWGLLDMQYNLMDCAHDRIVWLRPEALQVFSLSTIDRPFRLWGYAGAAVALLCLLILPWLQKRLNGRQSRVSMN